MTAAFTNSRKIGLRLFSRAVGWPVLLVFLLGSAPCNAQPSASTPKSTPSNTIRSWGDDAMKGIMAAWQQAFHAAHPEFTFQDTFYGSGTGMAGIITGTSDLALMGRPATANEIMGFEWVHRYKPLGVQVMTGSLGVDGRSPALAVLVRRSNPVRRITLTQLRMILGCPQQTGVPAIQTWGQLGLSGVWAAKPIHVYLYNNETGTGDFLQASILGRGDKWDWSRVEEYRDTTHKNGTLDSASRRIVAALNSDPYGIAVSTLSSMTPDLRALPLAQKDGGPYFSITRETLIERRYPLTRAVYIYVNRPPGKPLESSVRAFLQFVLSRQGQQIVVQQGDFLPLAASLAAEQTALLQ